MQNVKSKVTLNSLTMVQLVLEYESIVAISTCLPIFSPLIEDIFVQKMQKCLVHVLLFCYSLISIIA